jgi:tetratricopeptide (TPR) repeat protein
MLETIREFAGELLETRPERDDVRSRHSAEFLRLAVQFESHLATADEDDWLDRCDEDHGNIRVALRWAIDTGQARLAQRFAAALWRFWQQRGHLAEGRQWLEEVLEMPEGQEPTTTRAKALTAAGGIAWWQNDPKAASIYEQALAIEREHREPERLGDALYNVAFVEAAAGHLELAVNMYNEALDQFRQAGDEPGELKVLTAMAGHNALYGDWDAAIGKLEDLVEAWRRLGDHFHLADALIFLAVSHSRSGRPDEARACALESLEVFHAAGNLTGIASAVLTIAFLASWEGRDADAVRLGGTAASLQAEAGGGPSSDYLATMVGDPIAEARGRLPAQEASRLWEEGMSMTVDDAIAMAERPN